MTKVKKIKIVHIVNDLGIGGISRVVLDICSSADLYKYDIKIYVLSDDLKLASIYNLDPTIEVKTFSYSCDGDWSLRGYFKNAFIKSVIAKKSNEIVDEAIKDRPDILHVHVNPKELNLGVIIREKSNCSLLLSIHMQILGGSSFSHKILALIFRKTYKKYDLIGASKSIEIDVVKYKLIGKDRKFHLIENKINLNLYSPKPKQPKDHISVVYVARIGYPKAHEDLLRSWAKLKNESVPKKLFLIGPDAMENQMQLLAKELDVDDSVIFMGSQYKIADILNECDFAVFPSHSEGLPLALLEKMAMRLPVIVSDIPALTNIVKDNVNGLVFRCGEIDALSSKISILLRDADLRNRLGKKARETIEMSYGISNISSAYESIYEEIVTLK